MHPIIRNRADFRAHALAVKSAISANIPVKESAICEALARGYGANTLASLHAALDSGHTYGPDDFGNIAFTERLTELSGDRLMAEVAAVAIAGISLKIDIVKRSPARQREDRYSDVAYDVFVQVEGQPAEALAEVPTFFVPANFGGSSVDRIVRLASASSFKVDGKFAVTRNRNRQNLLTAKLVHGRWEGAMFLDLAPDADHSRYVRSATAALAREIVPAVSPWVRCHVFRPDHYEYGAWRVHMSLGYAARKGGDDGAFVFDLPWQPRRNIRVDQGYLFDLNPAKNVFRGKFVHGEWFGDIYSNGVAEDDNPIPIERMRVLLLNSASMALGLK